MAKGKKLVDALMSGVKTPAQMKMEMAVDRARAVLPKAERDANLDKMLKESAVKDPVYHSSKADINTFSPEYRTELSSMGHHFGTADQANFRTDQYDFSGDNVNIGKYYLNMKNPLETSHMGSFAPDHLAEQMMDLGILDPDKYDALSTKLNYESVPIGTELVKILKKNGYDGLKYANEREGDGFSYVPFDPKQIKSAIGNRGTYDLSEPDITKAQGGIIKMGAGGLGRKLGNLLPKPDGAFRPTQAGDTVGGYMVREDIPNRSSIGASLENYNTLGLQEVPMSAFGVQGKPQYYSTQNREYTQNLADQINQNKELNPLIVVKDKEGYYVLEGGHRFDALRELDAQSFPALVVEDLDGMARGGVVKMAKGGAGRKLADKILPKVEAPSVMTRSEITELADYIKNREGGYGLRRVERAADEIPRLGEMYTQDALRSAFSSDNASALMTMNPADFEKYAAPLLTNLSQRSMDKIANLKAIQNVGGFSSVPFFYINKELAGSTSLPFVTGHEGRHRSRAMDAAGVQSGLVQFLPRAELREPFPRRSQEQYIEAIRKEMELSGNKIKPEKYYLNEADEKSFQRPAIDLPDLYANGGAVKMAEGGEADQAEIDRMRLELSNSPVIQATPQTPFQRGIGTLGGYMNQAGEFINKAVEPIAESNPVKTFIAELFGDSFKSAGTALQDYTKTSREITEDQPYRRAPITGSGQTMSLDPRMLDVIGFADPVTRLGIKAGRAGVKAATPFAKDVGEMASEMYMKGDIPGMVSPNMFAVSPDGKPSKVLAPASDIGFYSPTEAAALNVQRRSGSGQAFLNDITKGENVKSDEISAMGLDNFLKGKTNVTADEVKDYIAQNKIQLGETQYGIQPKFDPVGMAKRKEVFAKYKPQIESLNAEINIIPPYMKADYAVFNTRRVSFENAILDLKIKRDAEADAVYKIPENKDKDSKFSSHQLPGGENYREIVLTLPTKTVSEAEARVILGAKPDAKLTEADINFASRKNVPEYQSSHFDEPNVLSHLRVSDRVTDGKKTLLLDEVQSDWHQAARDARTLEIKRLVDSGMSKNEAQASVPENFGYQLPPEVTAPMDSEYRALVHKNAYAVNQGLSPNPQDVQRAQNLERQLIQSDASKIPDAPYKEDWYQLTLRRAIKEAVDGGYDRVALPTGARVNERFDLSKQIDRIDYNKNDDGTYSMSAIKDGRQVFAKEDIDENEISGIVGKDIAKKMVGDEGAAQYDADVADELGIGVVKSLTGLDLKVGGAGNKKYYDEIYPTYLKKLGKKYGSESGMTTVDAKGTPEPLFYMDITPAMRKEFGTGIHMKRGGKVSFANDIDAMRLELTKG